MIKRTIYDDLVDILVALLIIIASITFLVSPSHGQVIPTGVILTWQWAGTGTPTYSVYRSTVSGGETQPPLASGLTAMTYTDTTAVVGTKYYYTFTATVGGVQSDPSPEVAAQITMPTPPTNPATAVY
jgi:fibronectin type 3 domain-containing protein